MLFTARSTLEHSDMLLARSVLTQIQNLNSYVYYRHKSPYTV